MKNTAEKVTKLLIGEKVRRLRTMQALSQEKLAEKAKVDVKTIQRLEKGDGARDDTLLRVAEAFEIPVTEFTMLSIDNGSLTQRSSQELNGLKMSLHELLENGKINQEEHYEMREHIEEAEKQRAAIELPPLPPPPENAKNSKSEIPPNEPITLLEKLDFFDAVKHALSETQPWVKYAPIDKNKPSWGHLLREYGFIFRPYISDFGPFRIGFFRKGIPPYYALFLAISRRESSEGLVVRLSPTLIYADWCEGTTPEVTAPFLSLFYRSRNNNAQLLNINLEWFHFDEHDLGNWFFDMLLQATANSTPNFEFTGAWFGNSYGSLFTRAKIYDSESYFFKRLIKVGKMNPVEIPWSISCMERSSISLNYCHPVPTIWHTHPKLISVEIKLPNSVEENSRIAISWPKCSIS